MIISCRENDNLRLFSEVNTLPVVSIKVYTRISRPHYSRSLTLREKTLYSNSMYRKLSHSYKAYNPYNFVPNQLEAKGAVRE